MLCALVPAAPASAGGAAEPALVLIMAPGALHTVTSRETVALIFNRKKHFWDDGTRIQPVNLSASHPLRRAFSLQIFGHTPEELEDYWRDLYFHGELPPYVLASEEAVMRFVAATPGAIGYVSHCVVDHRVSVVMQLDSGAPCSH
jgi:ABC-type phosphate transport system substrate-binding protein